MEICFYYLLGVIVAWVAFALFGYYVERKLTVDALMLDMLCSLGSWLVVLVLILSLWDDFVDWIKELWRKKE